jgi:ABC-type Mn2+/Zn2+ transport system ATPase subunit
MPNKRRIIIIAGPNGAAKTTFAREYLMKMSRHKAQKQFVPFVARNP